MKKQPDLQWLLGYAGSYKILTVSSRMLSVISALLVLLPYVYIWNIIKEVLDVPPNYSEAVGIGHNG